MTFVRSLVDDLRERRLWPLAAALLVAIVAVPVVLAKSPQPTPAVLPPVVTTSPMAHLTALPPVTLRTSLERPTFTGPARDPFQQGAPGQLATRFSAGTSTATGSLSQSSIGGATGQIGGSVAGATGTGAFSGGGAGAPSSSGGSTPPSEPPAGRPGVHPEGLLPYQSYEVTVGVTDPSGNLHSFDLPRGGVLPGPWQPQLVELGVLQGGKRVLFALRPNSPRVGAGECIPGRIDCELLALAPGQTGTLTRRSATGSVEQEQFAVTAISAQDHPSVAAARSARLQFAIGGAELLRRWDLPAQSLFAFRPALDALVDLRNLTVGGS